MQLSDIPDLSLKYTTEPALNLLRDRSGASALALEHANPATRLLEKRRELFEVQEAYENLKTEHGKKVSRWMG